MTPNLFYLYFRIGWRDRRKENVAVDPFIYKAEMENNAITRLQVKLRISTIRCRVVFQIFNK